MRRAYLSDASHTLPMPPGPIPHSSIWHAHISASPMKKARKGWLDTARQVQTAKMLAQCQGRLLSLVTASLFLLCADIFHHCLSLAAVRFLTKRKRYILVFDHVLNLSFHRQEEEYAEVHHENGPEHGYVKDGEECHANRCKKKCIHTKTLKRRNKENICGFRDPAPMFKPCVARVPFQTMFWFSYSVVRRGKWNCSYRSRWPCNKSTRTCILEVA